MNKPGLGLYVSSQLCCLLCAVFAQAELPQPEDKLLPEAELSSGYPQSRDPFIPLLDKEGNLRKDFAKPVITGDLAPRVNLTGISKVNNVFYAIVDGKWVKENDQLGDLVIDKIESDKITLRFGEKKFAVKLRLEKKQNEKN